MTDFTDLFTEYKQMEVAIRLGYLPEEVVADYQARQQAIYNSVSDIDNRKELVKLREHTCEFSNDYCIVCGLDGRA